MGAASVSKAALGRRRRLRRTTMEQSASSWRSGLTKAAAPTLHSAVRAALGSTMMHHTHVLLLLRYMDYLRQKGRIFLYFPFFCFLIQEKIPVSSFICNKDEKELVFFPLLYYNPPTQRNILPLKERWKKL